MNTKERFYLYAEFTEWLIEATSVSVESAKSYGVYLQSAFQKLKAIGEESGKQQDLYFEQIKAAVISGDEILIKDTILTFFQYLCKNGIEEELNYSKKYIQNWRSSLIKYGEFLVEWGSENSQEEAQNNEEENVALVLDNEIVVGDSVSFDKNNLYKVFTLRLISQDRFYNDVYFPISLIKKIFSKRKQKKAFDICINKMLDHTKIFYGERYYMLKEISKIDFRNGNVYVTHKNKEYPVYTKMADNKTLVPIATQKLKHMALDHEKPMFTIISEKISELIIFKELTKEIKKHTKAGKIDRKILAKISKKLFENGFTEQIELAGLEKELNHICSDISLQLMDTKQNASKGATYN
jgi:hypothetical protein